ncbi:MAG: hypothetical protein ACHQFZ_09330 [Acidimicrobiales bacterium]
MSAFPPGPEDAEQEEKDAYVTTESPHELRIPRPLAGRIGPGKADMRNVVDDLILDLLEWLGSDSRTYDEVLDAWRTSCPRLPVWEEANDRGFIRQGNEPGLGRLVSVTDAGVLHLREHRPRMPVR